MAKLFYLLTKGGHTSVVVFFVLSGYLISGSIFRSLDKGAFSFPTYLTHRLARLWSVLLPALAIGGLLDWLGIHHTTAHALYAGLVNNHTSHDAISNLRLTLGIEDALFLQRSLNNEFGSNAPLWSLSYEFWYYILFPLSLMLIRSRERRLELALGLAASTLICGMSILLYFPLWLAGVAVHKLPRRAFTHNQRLMAALSFFAAFFGSAVISERVSSIWLDILLSLATMGFLWVLLSSTSLASSEALYTILSRTIAGFSYTLYAVHFPALMLMTAAIVGNRRWALTPIHLAIGTGCLLVVYGWAYLLSWLFEQRTPVLQRLLHGLIHRLPHFSERVT